MSDTESEEENGWVGPGASAPLPPPSVLYMSGSEHPQLPYYSNETALQQSHITQVGGCSSDWSDLFVALSARNAITVQENWMEVRLPEHRKGLQTAQVVGLDMPHHTRDVVLGCNDALALNEGFPLTPFTHRMTWVEQAHGEDPSQAFQIRLPLRLTPFSSVFFKEWDPAYNLLTVQLNTCSAHYFTPGNVAHLFYIFQQLPQRPLHQRLSLAGVPLLQTDTMTANLNIMYIEHLSVVNDTTLQLMLRWPTDITFDSSLLGNVVSWEEGCETCPMLVLPPIPTLSDLVELVNLALRESVFSLGPPENIAPRNTSLVRGTPRFRLTFTLRADSPPYLVTLEARLQTPLGAQDYEKTRNQLFRPPIVFARGDLMGANDMRKANGLMQYLGFTTLDLLPKNEEDYQTAQTAGTPLGSVRNAVTALGFSGWEQRARLPYQYYSSVPVGSQQMLAFSPITGWAHRAIPPGFYETPEELTQSLENQLNALRFPDTLQGSLMVETEETFCHAYFCLPPGWYTPWGLATALQNQVPASVSNALYFALNTEHRTLMPSSPLLSSFLHTGVNCVVLHNQSKEARVRMVSSSSATNLWNFLMGDLVPEELSPGETQVLLSPHHAGPWLFSQAQLQSQYSVQAGQVDRRLVITQRGPREATVLRVCAQEQNDCWYLQLVLDQSLGVSRDDFLRISLSPGEEEPGCVGSLADTVSQACGLLGRSGLPLWSGMHRVLDAGQDAECHATVTLDIMVSEEEQEEGNCCEDFGGVRLAARTLQFPFNWVTQSGNYNPSFLLGLPSNQLLERVTRLCGVASVSLCGDTRRVFVQMEGVNGTFQVLQRESIVSQARGNAHQQQGAFKNTSVQPYPVAQFVLSRRRWNEVNCCENFRNPVCSLQAASSNALTTLRVSFLTEDGGPLPIEGTHVFLLVRFSYGKGK